MACLLRPRPCQATSVVCGQHVIPTCCCPPQLGPRPQLLTGQRAECAAAGCVLASRAMACSCGPDAELLWPPSFRAQAHPGARGHQVPTSWPRKGHQARRARATLPLQLLPPTHHPVQGGLSDPFPPGHCHGALSPALCSPAGRTCYRFSVAAELAFQPLVELSPCERDI